MIATPNQSILITGTTGQVGGALAPLFPDALTPTRADLDLSSEPSIRAYIRTHTPAWILNPAAYTAVDKAESEPALAAAINAEAPRILAEEAAQYGGRILHFSTDYVFDGTKPTPYTEEDPANPTNVYGRTKLAGEQALADTNAIILRTSWVFAPTGKNFLLTVLRVAAERPTMNIVADQHGAPTSAQDLARLAQHIVTQTPDIQGIFHATSAGETTWYGFAQEALRQLGRPDNLLPIPTSGYPTPATRPENSRLSGAKLIEATNFHMPTWQQALANTLAQL